MNRLTDTIEDTDIRFAKDNGIKPELCVFQKIYNPLVMYCRLMELGLDIEESLTRMNIYETYFYKPLLKRLEDGEWK